MNKKIIAFAGRKRSGKGVLSKLLSNEYNAKIITIADYLKYLCCYLLGCGYNELDEMKNNEIHFEKIVDEKWIDIINQETKIDKNIIKKEIGNITFTNARQMLQIIGTDLIRKYNPNWHINNAINEINKSKSEFIAIDDVRFPNEKNEIEKIGGTCYFMIRPKYMNVSNHLSEKSLFWYNFEPDKVILNNSSVKIMEDNFLLFNKHNITNNKLFLSENEEFLTPLCNLGKVYDIYTDKILREIINDDDFKYKGIINIKLFEDKNFEKFYDICKTNGIYHIDNPCVIENFKQWI